MRGTTRMLAQPDQSIVIGAVQTSQSDVLVRVDVEHGERPFKLWQGQIQSIVLDVLLSGFKSIQEDAYLPEVPVDSVRLLSCEAILRVLPAAQFQQTAWTG